MQSMTVIKHRVKRQLTLPICSKIEVIALLIKRCVMTGKYITGQQVKLYMKYRIDKLLTQAACAAKTGISTKSERNHVI